MKSNIPDFDSSRKFSSVFDSSFCDSEKIIGKGIIENHQPEEDAGVFSSLFNNEVKNEPIRETEYARNTDRFIADFFAKRRAKVAESLGVKDEAPPEFEASKSKSKSKSEYNFKGV